MILYHGSNEIVEIPDLRHSRKEVDFGVGFYVTPIKEQAERWASKRKLRYGTACISRYILDEDSCSNLSAKRFDSYSEEWLDFVVACRSGHYSSSWDIVIGGVANDRVFDTLEAYFDGFASKEQTIGRLKMERPNIQYCFRTVKALESLRFDGSEQV